MIYTIVIEEGAVVSMRCAPCQVDGGASCEISIADFPWRAEETLQALVS